MYVGGYCACLFEGVYIGVGVWVKWLPQLRRGGEGGWKEAPATRLSGEREAARSCARKRGRRVPGEGGAVRALPRRSRASTAATVAR